MAVSKADIKYLAIDKGLYLQVKEVFDIDLSKSKNPIASFGAFYKSELIGLLLASHYQSLICNISFFHVLPIFRDKGIGSELLSRIPLFCKAENIRNIRIKCDSKKHNIPKLESFLKTNNWSSFSYLYTIFKFRKESFYKNFIMKLFANSTSLLEDMNLKIISLNQFNNSDLALLLTKTKALVSTFTLPLNDETLIDELALFAFKGDELISWIIPCRIQSNEISVDFTFVRKDYRDRALGFLLWHEVFKKAQTKDFYEEIKWISLNFDKNNKRLLTLYQKLFKSYLYEEYDCFEAHLYNI